METSVPVVNGSDGCDKCVTTKKSGKSSCCARGGAWFKNCGDVGDPMFDHTWAEGIQACRDFATSGFTNTPVQATPSHVGAIVYAPCTVQSRNGTRQQTDMHRADSKPDADSIDFDECVGLTKVVMCLCVLSIVVHLQKQF